MEGVKPRTEQEVIVDDSFDFSGCEVVRREFFSHMFEPSVKFTYNCVQFNAACIRKLPDAMYVQFFVNQRTKQLIIRACDENAKDAVRWCTVNTKNGKRQSREIKGNIFSAKIYDMMGWNPKYRYKMLGTIICVQGEYIVAFKLEDCETYIPAPSKASAAEKAAARLGHLPMAWQNAFGLPIEEHESQLKVDVLDDFARYEVVKPTPLTPPKSQQMSMDFGEGGSGDGTD